MITRITFGPAPPPGRYSSGSRGTLSAKPEHPAAPSKDAPAAPAPATFKKSLRVILLNSGDSRNVHKTRTVPADMLTSWLLRGDYRFRLHRYSRARSPCGG